jgi:hypothetical protein
MHEFVWLLHIPPYLDIADCLQGSGSWGWLGVAGCYGLSDHDHAVVWRGPEHPLGSILLGVVEVDKLV